MIIALSYSHRHTIAVFHVQEPVSAVKMDAINQPAKCFDNRAVNRQPEKHHTRNVSDDDKNVLKKPLEELVRSMRNNTLSPFGEASIHGFSQELICDAVANCHNIFTTKYFLKGTYNSRNI